jgi:spore maturation protein CgeB
VDAPATLSALETGADRQLRDAVPEFDLVLTYGGGTPVVTRYERLRARRCVPIYNALDPSTHHPVQPRPELNCDLSFLGNRMPDREARVREFFFGCVERLPERTFILGGSGWSPDALGENVRLLGHVPTTMHNVLNASSLAVLNISRESMARNGHSPATRVFEAAGAGACLITDLWEGIEQFLEPGTEVLVARDGAEVATLLSGLEPERAVEIGSAARERVLREHTYTQRALQVEQVLAEAMSRQASLERVR